MQLGWKQEPGRGWGWAGLPPRYSLTTRVTDAAREASWPRLLPSHQQPSLSWLVPGPWTLQHTAQASKLALEASGVSHGYLSLVNAASCHTFHFSGWL
jgi:hypothetical protein